MKATGYAPTEESTMREKTIIYGKIDCPHTRRAREAIQPHEFVDVLENPACLATMLELSKGVRRVPVIVTGQKVSVGFNNGS